MKQAIAPVGLARNDFDTFADLAERFELRELFTELRDEMEWVRYLYETASEQIAKAGRPWIAFDEFWERGYFEMPRIAEADHPVREVSQQSESQQAFDAVRTHRDIFREDCGLRLRRLPRTSGLAGARRMARQPANCEEYPLHMITTQPSTRLHGQMDMGRVSQATKVAGREPIRINRDDAAARGISSGDIVRVFNASRRDPRGRRRSATRFGRGVVQMATGAWYDPEHPGVIGSLDKHGNPNVLTLDKGTSKPGAGTKRANHAGAD